MSAQLQFTLRFTSCVFKNAQGNAAFEIFMYPRSHVKLLWAVVGCHFFCTNPGQQRSHISPQVLCSHLKEEVRLISVLHKADGDCTCRGEFVVA